MAKPKYRIIVPKAGAADEFGATAKLYPVDEIVEPAEDWQDDVMKTFVANGWATEVKVDAPDEVAEEPKRARNEDGTLIGDDPDTPDVNEAWEGGEAPKTKKKATKKKATKKKAPAKKKATKKKAK